MDVVRLYYISEKKGRRKGKNFFAFGQDERQQKRLQNDAANRIPCAGSIDFLDFVSQGT